MGDHYEERLMLACRVYRVVAGLPTPRTEAERLERDRMHYIWCSLLHHCDAPDMRRWLRAVERMEATAVASCNESG